jgi:hypothetical protein
MIKIKNFLLSFSIVSIVLFFGCKKDTFIPVPGKCPVIVSTNPSNNGINVPRNQVITATFNEAINPETLTLSSFTLTGPAIIPGTLSYDDSNFTLSFVPSAPLAPNTSYTGKVSSSVKDRMGNALQTDYIWTFSTGPVIIPVVITTDPANNATGVVLNKTVMANFNMPMDPATINNVNFTVKQGSTAVSGTVTYNGTTASFIPAAYLISNTVYTCTIHSGAKNTLGTAMASNYIWTFITGSVIAPVVIATDAPDNATNVALNKVLTATFNMPMDPSTISASTFNIRQGATIVTGTITYSGTTASFTPSANFLPGTAYTATITSGAKNVQGIPLANNYIWKFTTIGTAAPLVLATDPANNATGVVLNKIVYATFNMPMDPSTITGSTFTLKQGSAAVSGTVSYTGNTASFSPAAPLLPGLTYTANISNSVKNVNGVNLLNTYIWTFKTGNTIAPAVILTDPANNAGSVALNKTVSATFSMPMDPSTINGNTFTLKQGNASISASVSYSGVLATLTPSVNLVAGTTYTATISTGAKNLAGIPVANNYVWTFTTLSVNAPMVISTDPANNATGVALNKIVTGTFNMNMDPLTITALTFTLKNGSALISGLVSYSGNTASFTPAASLSSGATYTATITSGAKNTSGTPMANNYAWTFTTGAHAGPSAPDLKSVARFGIIAGVGVSNNAGPSKINDLDVGIYPGVRSSVTGFPPATVNNGAIYCSDDLTPAGVAAMLKQAKLDLTAAYLYAEGATSPAPASVSGDQGGKTLAPGIYKSTSTLLINSGDLTLDAKGDPNAVWIFQVASAFTTVGGTGGNVILSGGAQAKNIYWQVGSSATIGDYTSFKGNILALTSITMNSHATAVGRMLCINGAVVMTSTNTIDKP